MKNPNLTIDEKKKYLKIALAAVKLAFEDNHLKTIINLYDAILIKGGDLSINEIVKIASDADADNF